MRVSRWALRRLGKRLRSGVQDDLFAATVNKRGAWPSEQLAAYMKGDGAECSPAIRSWARFYIWDAAARICKMPSLEKRRAALAKVLDALREQVKDDMKRIWGASK